MPLRNEAPSPPAHLVRAHLERIMRSAAFARADRLRAFLTFVVDKTLAGAQEEVKEYSIALAVCGRHPSFDARTDPIVRVDANRLRARLDAYYRLEGRSDRVRIQVPKGTYVPSFLSVAPPPLHRHVAALVVLPFVHFGSHQDHESFADGLTEELIHQLSRNPDLRVIGRMSAFHYRDTGGDLSRIAAELDVGHVIEGSVRWAGDDIRVTVQLTDARTSSVLWSERYERRLCDVFSVQDDVCDHIARALQIHLVQPGRSAAPSRNAGAHVEYLKGRHCWNRRTGASLAQSLDYYRRALAIDPEFAPAHCGIADTFLVQALNEQVDGDTARLHAGSHARQATALAPDLAEALTSAAAVASALEWDWDRGDALFVRAIELNPSFSLAHYLRAIMNLAPRAQWDEALIAMDRALEIDPVSPVLHRDLGIVHYLRGEYRDAEESLRVASTLEPSFTGAFTLFWLGRTQVEQGRFDEALETFRARSSEPFANTRVLASIVHTLGLMGRRAEAADRFEDLRQQASRRRVPPLNLAIALLGLGRHDEALTELERACGEHAAPLYQLGVDPLFGPLRGSDRYRAILHRMGLEPAS